MLKISLNEQSKSFAPSETISGSVVWSELSPKTERLEVRLIWYTEGKGDTDVEIITAIPTPNPGANGTTKFTFAAPRRPYSFSGKLISVIWAIEVVEFPSLNAEVETIVISPSRQEIILDKSLNDQASKAFFRMGN